MAEIDKKQSEKCLQLIKQKAQELDKVISTLSTNVDLTINEYSVVNFDSILKDVINANQNALNEFNIEVSVNITVKKVFKTSEPLLKTILNNLLSNAIKFRDPNKLSTIIKVNIYDAISGVSITISDNGIGIPQNAQKSAFKIFFNADNSINSGGLGMFNVKQSVRKLGGHITLSSETGTGTTFKIDIPSKFNK